VLAFETEDVLQAWALPMENIIGVGGFVLALATDQIRSDIHTQKTHMRKPQESRAKLIQIH